LRASNVSPDSNSAHLDQRESTAQEMLKEFPLVSSTTIMCRTIAVLL